MLIYTNKEDRESLIFANNCKRLIKLNIYFQVKTFSFEILIMTLTFSDNFEIDFKTNYFKNPKLKTLKALPLNMSMEIKDHYPLDSNLRRCAMCAPLERRTHYVCAECKVPLCLNLKRKCFEDYHNLLFTK